MAWNYFWQRFAPKGCCVVRCGISFDVTKIVTPDTFERPIYAEIAIETVRIWMKKKLITLRQTAFQAATAQQPTVVVEELALLIPQKKHVFSVNSGRILRDLSLLMPKRIVFWRTSFTKC